MNLNINTNDPLSNSLNLVTYNGGSIITPVDKGLNINMGIGLWSVQDKLSAGLPLDVLHMLLSAAIMRAKICEANSGKSSKVIILIADSMAAREAIKANIPVDEVTRVAELYLKSLHPLLNLLKIKDNTDIILSSELETSKEYKKVSKRVTRSRIVQELHATDPIHCSYIATQTAITEYMNKYEDVGIKLGWLYGNSVQELSDSKSAKTLIRWDELKFDRWHQDICPGSAIQYLYTRSGLKHSPNGKHVNVIEACPYIACEQDLRYVVQTRNKLESIKSICPLQKKVAKHWQVILETYLLLKDMDILDREFLPANCFTNNLIATVYKMLNHLSNAPFLQCSMACEDTNPFIVRENNNAQELTDSYCSG